MTATLTMVPVAKIRPRKPLQPTSDFAEEQMAELVESVKRHGIITPLTLAPDGDGFVIVAGERRYRAAKQAKLKDVPAQVRDADGDALTLAVAENVIRADLNPVEEAHAYARLVAEHGDAAKVAKLVGRSEKLIGERLELLRLPEEARALLAARKVPLACAPALIRIAKREPLLAALTAAWLAAHPAGAGWFPTAPGEVVDDVLRAEWRDDDGNTLHPVAYSVGGWHGPLLPGERREEPLPRILAKLAEHGEAVAAAYGELPESPRGDEYDWQARQAATTATSPTRSGSRIGSRRRSARTQPPRPSAGSGSGTRGSRPPHRTTPRRKPAASSGSATARRGSPPARGISTSERRSPSGNRRWTRTP